MDLILTLGRFAQFLCALLLWGLAIFRAGLLPPGWRTATVRPARRIGLALAVVNLLAAICWFAAQAAIIGDGPDSLATPGYLVSLVTGTHFGRAFALHLALAALLVAVSVTGGARTVAFAAAANLVSLSPLGHAAMHSGLTGGLHLTADALHLLAAGFWVGGLIGLLPCLSVLPDPVAGPVAGQVLRRFSRTGHFAVALVLASGFANSLFILWDRPAAVLSAAYLGLLGAKLLGVLVMILLALHNRYVLVPCLKLDPERGVRALRRGTLAEIGLALAVLALVSLLGTMSPLAGA